MSRIMAEEILDGSTDPMPRVPQSEESNSNSTALSRAHLQAIRAIVYVSVATSVLSTVLVELPSGADTSPCGLSSARTSAHLAIASRESSSPVNGSYVEHNAMVSSIGDPMLRRLNGITSDEDLSISVAARKLAVDMIANVAEFTARNRDLPRPNIFANRAGEISFEWLPHVTSSDIIASALISVDGHEVEYFITNGDRVVFNTIVDTAPQQAFAFLTALQDVLLERNRA